MAFKRSYGANGLAYMFISRMHALYRRHYTALNASFATKASKLAFSFTKIFSSAVYPYLLRFTFQDIFCHFLITEHMLTLSNLSQPDKL